MLKESYHEESERAYVPVDGKPFQILRSEKVWREYFAAAGLRVMKTFYGEKEPDNEYNAEILWILVPNIAPLDENVRRKAEENGRYKMILMTEEGKARIHAEYSDHSNTYAAHASDYKD